MKRRIIKIVGIAAAVLLFTGYFAFSTFVFSPFESDYEFDLATLVPRDVDYFSAKSDLEGEFSSFPKLDFMRRMERSERGQRILASPEWQARAQELGLDQWFTDLEQQLAALPIPVDPLAVVGGREMALAGYATADTFERSEWAAYLRTNWVGKLGVSMLDYPGLLGLDAQGLKVESNEDHTVISGGEIQGSLFVTRVRDVLVVSNASRLVVAARDLNARAGEDSLGQSASFHDNVTTNVRDGDEVKFAIDYADVASRFGWPMDGPNATSPEAPTAFLGRMFQYSLMREMTGLIGFKRGLSIEIEGEFNSDSMTPLQRKVYRQRDADQQAMLDDVARFAPEDVGLFLYGEADLESLLGTYLSSIERAARSNLETEILRPVFGFDGVDAWVEDLATIFDDRFAFFMRENDYATLESDPPSDGLPTMAWTLVLWVENLEKLEAIRGKINGNQARFGIRGAESGSAGVFVNEVDGGNSIFEYWAPLVPGTGHIASASDQDFLIVSNNFRMLGQVLATYYGTQYGQSGERSGRLSDFGPFQGLVNAGLPSATVAVWINPRAIGAGLRAIERQKAEDNAFRDVDWTLERQRIEKSVLKERYPEEVWGALTPGVQEQIDPLVEEEIEVFRRQYRAQRVPALAGYAERMLDSIELIKYGLVQLRLELKDFQLEARLIAPLDD
ncbi:hypothetical protein [Engelhardtia mirabilis]|uniref:DUF3352 domain-containing protein n=1 Tax=Engelhardtia mirabilis TaxID=2528011 RepID=A0A518BNX2_9BACT|nr:hypothetical protein Pla133_37830 [Planctomycetes bacterium Pla133]QDV03007.1 hypothetical protein Pla86_37820 [Planctomycetes bacterium Pla86]